MNLGDSIWSDLQGIAFRQAYIDVGGVSTRFLQAGDPATPALVFLHGTGGHAEAYVRNLAAHARHFNTIAIDMLGHGYTGKPDFDYESRVMSSTSSASSMRWASPARRSRANRSAAGSRRIS